MNRVELKNITLKNTSCYITINIKTETPERASYANGVTDEVRNEKERATYEKCKL
jgi:hypothetical protein